MGPRLRHRYQIQVSPNGSTWTTVYSTTTGKGFHEELAVSGTGRYVRLAVNKRSSAYGYSLYDFDVYGTGGNPVQPPAHAPAPTFSRLAWSDEFNTAAGTLPDPAKWTIDPGTGQNNEIQYYTNNQNARMDGAGNLVIEARRETAGGRDYTSHRMNTGGKFEFEYGRVEARVKVPEGNGLWPAFWMMGADFLTGRPWPYNGEIDIMEVLGRNTREATPPARPAVQRRRRVRADVHGSRRRQALGRVPRVGRRVGCDRHPVLPRRCRRVHRQQGDRPGDQVRGCSTTRST